MRNPSRIPRFTHAFTRQPVGAAASGSAERNVPASSAARSSRNACHRVLIAYRSGPCGKVPLNPCFQTLSCHDLTSIVASGLRQPKLVPAASPASAASPRVTGTIGSRSVSSHAPHQRQHRLHRRRARLPEVRLHQPEVLAVDLRAPSPSRPPAPRPPSAPSARESHSTPPRPAPRRPAQSPAASARRRPRAP